jgi:hypothetical protein
MNLYGRIFKISATQSLVPTTVSPTPSAAAPNVSAPEAIMPKATNTKAANSSSPVLLTTTIAKSTSPLGVAVDGTLPKATIANNSASKVTTISILAPKATALNGTIPSGSAANSMASLGGTFANSNIPKPTSSNAAPPKATALSPPSGWSYKGCYVDAANGRIFNTQQPDLSTLTVESCISTCAGLGYSVAGMEYVCL